MSKKLHPETRIGEVHLTVRDVDRSIEYYTERLGFVMHHRENDSARLGVGEDDLLVLVENPAARQVRGTAGLYHFAVLLPTRAALARALHHIADRETAVTGFADHLVSEAIYLPDQDGNGIEIYRDRPRDEWPYENGTLQMATDPLNLDELMSSLKGQKPGFDGLPAGTTIGHVHLHVSDIPQAEAFYRDLIGFDLMVRYGSSASFLSAGGYHHHLGINVWPGQGVPPAPDDAVGLRYYEIVVPDKDTLDEVQDRLEGAEYSHELNGDSIRLRDPAGNGVRIVADG